MTERLVSPCIGICELNDEEPIRCRGCGRTVKEIGDWRYATYDRRMEILRAICERWKAAGDPPADDKAAQLIHKEMGERFRLAGLIA